MNQYTYKTNANLRYHIGKELEKDRRIRDEKEKIRLIDIIIPVFSATFTIAATFVTSQNYGLSANTWWIAILCFPFIFLVIYWLSKIAVRLWNHLFRERIKKIQTENYQYEEQNLNRFNYEAVNLIYLCYTLLKEENEDRYIQKYNYMEAVFYLNAATDKLHKVFVSYDMQISNKLIPPKKIVYVFEMYNKCIELIHDNAPMHRDYEAYIHDIRVRGNKIIREIYNKYNITLKQIPEPKNQKSYVSP